MQGDILDDFLLLVDVTLCMAREAYQRNNLGAKRLGRGVGLGQPWGGAAPGSGGAGGERPLKRRWQNMLMITEYAFTPSTLGCFMTSHKKLDVTWDRSWVVSACVTFIG